MRVTDHEIIFERGDVTVVVRPTVGDRVSIELLRAGELVGEVHGVVGTDPRVLIGVVEGALGVFSMTSPSRSPGL